MSKFTKKILSTNIIVSMFLYGCESISYGTDQSQLCEKIEFDQDEITLTPNDSQIIKIKNIDSLSKIQNDIHWKLDSNSEVSIKKCQTNEFELSLKNEIKSENEKITFYYLWNNNEVDSVVNINKYPFLINLNENVSINEGIDSVTDKIENYNEIISLGYKFDINDYDESIIKPLITDDNLLITKKNNGDARLIIEAINDVFTIKKEVSVSCSLINELQTSSDSLTLSSSIPSDKLTINNYDKLIIEGWALSLDYDKNAISIVNDKGILDITSLNMEDTTLNINFKFKDKTLSKKINISCNNISEIITNLDTIDIELEKSNFIEIQNLDFLNKKYNGIISIELSNSIMNNCLQEENKIMISSIIGGVNQLTIKYAGENINIQKIITINNTQYSNDDENIRLINNYIESYNSLSLSDDLMFLNKKYIYFDIVSFLNYTSKNNYNSDKTTIENWNKINKEKINSILINVLNIYFLKNKLSSDYENNILLLDTFCISEQKESISIITSTTLLSIKEVFSKCVNDQIIDVANRLCS